MIRRPAVQVGAFAAALVIVKVLVSAQTEPRSIEAYHWLYAQHLDLGYFDHPGMIAWMIWLSTALFGNGTVGLRMLTTLGGAAAVWLAFLTGRRLYDERVGRLAALLVGLVPLTFQFGSEASPDAPLLLFWAAAFWALARVLSGDGAAWWYAAGAFLGLAMDSKYSAVFIGVGTLLFLIFSPGHRAWLGRPHPYMAALLALAVFSPTLVWNARHEWQSLVYQGVERFEERPGLSWKELRDFPIQQVLLVTPFVCAWAWAAGVRSLVRWKTAAWQDRLAACLGMPILLFFALLTFWRSTRGHWPGPAYVSLLVLAAAAVERGGKWGRWLNIGTVAVLVAACVVLPAALIFVPRAQLRCWGQFAREVERRHAAFVVAQNYHEAAQIGYQLRSTAVCDFTAVGRPGKSFRNWWKGKGGDFARRDAVVVVPVNRYPESLAPVRERFDRVDAPEEVVVTRPGGWQERFVLVRATGYRP